MEEIVDPHRLELDDTSADHNSNGLRTIDNGGNDGGNVGFLHHSDYRPLLFCSHSSSSLNMHKF